MALSVNTPFQAWKPATLVELLHLRVESEPDRPSYVYLSDGELDEISITYKELERQAKAIAVWLLDHGAYHERVLLLYPPGLEYLAAYFGCLYAGAVAVPAYPPRLNRPTPRIQGIVADAGAHFALTTGDILSDLERRFEQTPDLQELNWLDTRIVPAGLESAWHEPKIAPADLAFLQYTSGSTSQPKGVMVTHANLLHNLQQIYESFHLFDPSIIQSGVVSWLPTYHDMGLIGGILGSLYGGIKLTILSPLAFLQRPLRWLQAISRYGAGISGGPNFAYDACIEKVKPEVIETLDLSGWKLAFSGAEPVRPNTLERFAEIFAPSGFRKEAFFPCYGLAEATLFVTGGDGPTGAKLLPVSRSGLENGQAVLVNPDEQGSVRVVSCGKPRLEQEILIVDPDTNIPCQDGCIGEIWLQGGSVAEGYWDRLEETQRVFRAHPEIDHEGAFLRTGDLGFLWDSELYISGRLKDLIIIRGANHYPQDIELTVENSHSALQSSGGAAFSVEVNGEEKLVVLQEVNRQSRHGDLSEAIQAIRMAISENHDLQVYEILLIRPMTIPKTSSGKIQRHACKKAYLDGSLEVLQGWRVGG